MTSLADTLWQFNNPRWGVWPRPGARRYFFSTFQGQKRQLLFVNLADTPDWQVLAVTCPSTDGRGNPVTGHSRPLLGHPVPDIA